METVTLRAAVHRGAEHIFILCAPLKALNDVIKRLPQVRWSRTYKAWYVPLSFDNYNKVSQALARLAVVETGELRKYLVKRKGVQATKVPAAVPVKQVPSPGNRIPFKKDLPSAVPSAGFRLSDENLGLLKKVIDHLVLKAYSSNTIRTYRSELICFFQVLGAFSAAERTTDEVKRYLRQCLNKGLSEHTLHSRINALKFCYEQVLGKDKFFFEITASEETVAIAEGVG